MKSSEHTGEAHTFSLSRHFRSRFVSGLFVLIPHPDSMAMGFVTGTMLDPEGDLRYRVFVPKA